MQNSGTWQTSYRLTPNPSFTALAGATAVFMLNSAVAAEASHELSAVHAIELALKGEFSDAAADQASIKLAIFGIIGMTAMAGS